MNKGEFVKIIAQKMGETDKKANAFYKAFVETVVESLNKDEKIILSGFGSFEIKERPSRTRTNPSNGQKVQIPQTKVPSIKMSKSFKDSFND